MGSCQGRRRGAAPAGGEAPTASGPTVQECCEALRRSSCKLASKLHFPMYVVRVSDFLSMSEARPHQVLKKEGVVREYCGELGVALFVSHQWCSQTHPDPHFAQLGTLQALLRRAFKGQVHIHCDLFSLAIFQEKVTMKAKDLQQLRTGCVWYDYFSVPQPRAQVVQSDRHVYMEEDMGKAVMSIPAYVERCKFFVVLAPPVAHTDFKHRVVDYHSWKQRGWCRLERAARILSPRETTLLLVCREDVAYQVGAKDYLMDSVGEGEYSMDVDRYRLAPVVTALMENKLQSLLQQQDLRRYRRILAARTSMLRGLPGVSPHDLCAPSFQVERKEGFEVDSFFRLYGFKTATDKAGGSTEPILYAAWAGDIAAVRGLLALRADIDSREGQDDGEFMVTKGQGVLHLAAMSRQEPAVIGALLELRADVKAKNKFAAAPLIWAAGSGSVGAIDVLLEARADVNAGSTLNVDALMNAATFGRAAAVERLLRGGASGKANADGISALTCAAMFAGGGEVVEALVAAPGCDVDARYDPQPGTFSNLLMHALSLPHRLLGRRSPLSLLGYHCFGSTPLGIAAIMGHVTEARALVAGGADVLARNRRGKMPAELAQLGGVSADNLAYFRAGVVPKGSAEGAPGAAPEKAGHSNSIGSCGKLAPDVADSVIFGATV